MTGETGDSSWVNLLSDGVHVLTPITKPSSVSRKRGMVTVSDCTPLISTTSRAREMESSQLCYHTACQKLEQQAQLITTLMSDNATLVSQVESWASKSDALNEEQILEVKEQALQGLMAHIRNLRHEFKLLSSKFKSPPHASSLLGDLERLTHKNADLCSALAATQYSRNILEREMIVLKRTLLKERSKLFASNRDAPHLKRIMDENVNLKNGLDQSQLKLAEKEVQLERLKKENVDLKAELGNLRQSQLKEIDRRCKEVDNLKLQLSHQLDSLQKDHDMQSYKLTELTEEKNKLLNRVHTLEELKTKLTHQSGVLESRLSSMSNHAEQLESENSALRSQLAQVQRDFEGNNPESHGTSIITDDSSIVESSLDRSCGQQLCHHRFHLSSSPVHNQRSMADVMNLKQQLADSRHHNVRLEIQLAQLKTDNAKLFGSYQAIVSIRNQLSQENTRLLISSKDFNSQKVHWLREKDGYQSKLDEMSAHAVQLDSNLSAMKDELHQVSELCKRRQEQLTEYASCVTCVDQLKAKLDCLQDLVAAEVDHLGTLTSEYDNHSTILKQQVLDTVENIRICGTVNSTRICQIEMCDESVTHLQGELEVLRARKAVLMCVSKQNTSNSFFPLHATYDDCSGESKLRQKLKLQRKQINFLRVKLGYTLSELRLYKQLKEACDQQLSELESCLEEVKKQHYKCAARLVAAEQQLDKHRFVHGH